MNTDITYNEFINNIIETRGQWSEEVYNSEYGCDMHHIIPACLGGEGDYIHNKSGKSIFKKHSHHKNCIYLYPKEHYIAHKLLYMEHPEIYGLYSAWVGTSKNGNLSEDDYEEIRKYNHNLPDYVQKIVNAAGDFHYNKRNDHISIKDTTNYRKEQERRKQLGISGLKGEKNGMYNKGYKISNGNNGHASIRYYYKDKVFESRKELIEYLDSIGEKITSSALRLIIHNKATLRVYNMYKDVLDHLRWEYKDNEDKENNL